MGNEAKKVIVETQQAFFDQWMQEQQLQAMTLNQAVHLNV